MKQLDEKLKNNKDQFEKSIPTSFTEQDKQAVMNQINQRKPNRTRKFLPIASSIAAIVVATLFVIFMFNNDKFERSVMQKDNTANRDEMDVANDYDADADNNADAESGVDANITGYIMNIDGDEMLVIANHPKDYSPDGGVEEFYNAIMFSDVPDDVEVGDFVHVWAQNGINESYPGQGTVGRLEEAEVSQPEDALLTEAEAIQKAIEYGKETGEFVNDATAIREIDFHRYSRENATWSIEFYDTVEEKSFLIEIQDQ